MKNFNTLLIRLIKKVSYHIFRLFRKTSDHRLFTNHLKKAIVEEKSLAVGRVGSTEVKAILYYKYPIFRSILKPLMGYDKKTKIFRHLINNSGFLNADNEDDVIKFGKLYNDAWNNINVIGSWRTEELFISKSKKLFIELDKVEPFFHDIPWTNYLKGKKVLVIHPFSHSIKKQLPHLHNRVFKKPIWNKSTEFIVYQAFQGLGNEKFDQSWFDILDKMKNDIDKLNFDCAIIGCGAFGLPLASHIKYNGKIAIHLGGATQILFGITGTRWENDQKYSDIITNSFIFPSEIEKPNNYKKIEDGCYW
jgi:hypothetical protein